MDELVANLREAYRVSITTWSGLTPQTGKSAGQVGHQLVHPGLGVRWEMPFDIQLAAASPIRLSTTDTARFQRSRICSVPDSLRP